ncbi:coiled-coil-helix-coiled-coil-helix domain-containing protein 7 [Diachasma alloeum]|uniref:coiled-coil-helix-coiled-coil-helix domain-containing protein 7 n=1 Tax=Diachasma alloeum TaxID=454923 RepID=UPI00073810CF|nr:coiled-coil-helix-coiled-coil-helix domain-containing protein 7 [Diachasma alloeum]
MAKNKSEIETVRQEAILKNPCFEESEGTRKCLEKNVYDRKPCFLYFENFKRCKQFWNIVKWTRRSEGIEPELPPPDERKKIKAEFMQKLHGQ